jgi:hypothetical protein
MMVAMSRTSWSASTRHGWLRLATLKRGLSGLNRVDGNGRKLITVSKFRQTVSKSKPA